MLHIDALNYLQAADLSVKDRGYSEFESDTVTLHQAVAKSQSQLHHGPIVSYFSRLSHAHHKPVSVLLAAVELHKKHSLPFFVISHDEHHEVSAQASAELITNISIHIPPHFVPVSAPAVVKTITLSVHVHEEYKHLLISQLGHKRLSDAELKKISESTGISLNHLKKHSHLNHQFDPISHFGRVPGMVGPFPDHIDELTALIYIQSQEPSIVAVRYTPADTVFMCRHMFEALLSAYSQLHQLPCHTIMGTEN